MVSTKEEMNFYSNLGFNVIAVGTEMNFNGSDLKFNKKQRLNECNLI